MKKVALVLATLAFVSCKFNETGNKNIIPESDGVIETEHVDHNDDLEVVEVDGELDSDGNYIYNVGELTTITLPNGGKLEVGNNSTESKLFEMLSDDKYIVDENDKTKGWVTLDRIYFATGSDELSKTSIKQIDNIVNILKAFPNVNVKLGGYTDNTGSQEINQPLSDGRAKSVMNDITKGGIDSNRLSAEGYGSEHPICPANDTDLCKAKNRRVDIRLTKK